MKTSLVICGATGFIGRNLTGHFAQNGSFDVSAVYFQRPPYNQNKVKWLQADLRNPADVERVVQGADIVIQAAATTSGAKDIVTRPYIHVTDNAVMNSYLLRAAHQFSVKHFIFFSCSNMYPSSAKPLREDEWDRNLSDSSPYFAIANTKVYVEKMCEFYAKVGNMKCSVIRHSNIYGPYDKFDLERSHLIGATISKAMVAEDRLTVWGSGEEERDVLYVHDLVRFVELLLWKQKDRFRLYNCGMGHSCAVNAIVKIILDSAGKADIKIEHDISKPTIKTKVCLDCSLAWTELGWKPTYSPREGILQTVKWWKKNINPATLKLHV